MFSKFGRVRPSRKSPCELVERSSVTPARTAIFCTSSALPPYHQLPPNLDGEIMIALPSSTIRRLDRWLETDPDRFERYLRKHPEVADVYENLNNLSDQVRSVLSEAVAVPVDFATRMLQRNTGRSDTDERSVALDLFGVGFETFMTLLDDSPIQPE